MSETVINGPAIVRVCNGCDNCNKEEQVCTNKDLAEKRFGKEQADFFGLNKIMLIVEGNLLITPPDCPRV